MPATATLITGTVNGDSSMLPVITRENGKYAGVRYWLVKHSGDSRDPDEAVTAVGVPAEGTAWSSVLPNLKVRSLRTRVFAGELSVVEVRYAENDPNVWDPPAPPPMNQGVKRTETRPSVVQVAVRKDASGAIIPGKLAAMVEVGSIELVVYAYGTRVQSVAAFAAWKNAVGRVISGAIDLPNFMGSGSAVNVSGGQLLVRDFGSRFVDYDQDINEWTLTLGYRDDWKFDWIIVNEETDVIQSQGESIVYPTVVPASVLPIWSGV